MNKLSFMKTTLKKTVSIVFLLITILLMTYCHEKDNIGQVTNINCNITPFDNGTTIVSDDGNDTVTIKFLQISDITAHNARATGSIVINTNGDLNNFGDIKYGICWDTIIPDCNYSPSIEPQTVYDEFSLLMYDLLPNTMYYVKLYISSKKNTQVGNEQNTSIEYGESYRTFTTLSE